MNEQGLLRRLTRFVGQLEPEDLDRVGLLAELEELGSDLATEDLAALGDPGFSFERTDSDVGAVSARQRQRLGRFVAARRRPAPARFRVFRREVALARTPVPGSQPEWAQGVEPARTIGPLRARDGRRFWLDLFPIFRPQAVYRSGETEPALLLPAAERGWQEAAAGADGARKGADKGAKKRGGRGLPLAKGSLWVRADLLAAGAPAGAWVGLEIDGGRIAFSAPPQIDGRRLTLPPGATCSVAVELGRAEVPASTDGYAGRDAADAELAPPAKLEFHFSDAGGALDAVGRGGWKLYGQKIEFSWREDEPATFEPALNALLVPLTADAERLTVERSRSAFARAAGAADLVSAAWLLPLSIIDPSQPTAATGAGALAVQGNSDLTLTWRGLRDGPIDLPQPWIALFPGLLVVVDLTASNLYAHQRFRLWSDEDSDYRSTVRVRFTDSFPLIYAAGAGGTELLMARCNGEAKLDRPVDVADRALDIRSESSLLVLSFTDAQQLVLLHDDNILFDHLDPNQPPAPQIPRPIALALRNALFTVTPVNGFLLFAELLDEEMVDVGHVLLVFGLYGFLPALPDPYAANVRTYRRYILHSRKGGAISLLLLGHVAWQKAAGDDDPDEVDTRFLILPLGQAGAALLAATTQAPAGGADSPAASHRKVPPLNEKEWDRQFGAFYREQFALLDVSTNADWMGVSLGWFDPERISDNDYIFYRVYGVGQPDGQTQSLFPLQVRELDLTAEGRFVRAFTVPQISWEPLINLTPPSVTGDPPFPLNFYPDDGGPTRLFNDNRERVAIAPLPKVDELLDYFDAKPDGFTGALFTLPFGLKAFAEINRDHPQLPDARLRRNQKTFRDGVLKGGLQLRVDAPERAQESPMFIGGTLQLNNIVLPDGTETGTGNLGSSVAEIFNREFFELTGGWDDRGVPLERIDFSGYGASTGSRWENPEAAFAETSQAQFDVFIGRTAHEVIQVRSVIYPLAIRVVRTIVVFRAGSSYVYRFDTGWQAETPGVYDFGYNVSLENVPGRHPRPNPYEIHPGIVQGVYDVKNITETPAIPRFERVWNRQDGDPYIDGKGYERTVDNTTPPEHRDADVILQPVYYDANVDIEFVETGAVGGRVPSKGLLGFVQLAPKGIPIPEDFFRDLLRSQYGSLGGPVDCLIDIGDSGQKMRLTRVDVSESVDAAGSRPLFVGTARGSVVLPKDGSWSVTQYADGTGEVTPLPDDATVPLVRRGPLGVPTVAPLRLDNPMELVRAAAPESIFFGLLQSTGTQKALFRKPRFKEGVDELLSETPDFSDAYRMLNSAALFPNLADTIPLDLGSFKTRIIEEGFHLLDELQPDAVLEKALPDGPWYIIDEDFLKLYVEYDKRDKDGAKTSDGSINFGIDSAAQDLGKRWLSKLNDIGMVVDLGPLERMMIIKGKFDAEKGAAPSFQGPELEFGDTLQPVIDILQILLMLQGGDYADALAKGLEIAMSNSADSWEYSFHARKEIPVVRFPPPALDSPTAPLKLECGLTVGVYFNEVFSPSGGGGQLVPSAGAFLGFYGRVSVMCVSVAAATIYATGSVELDLAADTQLGPSLRMKFGFGAEINVGLPVIGNVSLLYMVGVEIILDNTKVVVAAFLLFRGRAEILGGIVTVTIFIEAKGIVERISGSDETNMIAQVTFGLDISIFWVINISFTESWQEQRQIA